MNWSTAEENEMLIIPLKVTKRYDMHGPLASWMDSQQGKLAASSQECRQDLTRLASIRNCISSSICTYYNHKGAIDDYALRDCMEYQAVLKKCEDVGFPVRDGEALELELGWDCAFERDGQLMIRSNIRHERICVLFNVAALESYLASKEDLSTKAGLVAAVKKYNVCAGIFRHLTTHLLPQQPPDVNPSNDLSVPCLSMCEKLTSAQAQSCIYDVARVHTRAKPSVLAKLAMGAAELFGEALLLADERTVRARTTKAGPWLARLKVRSATYRAQAEWHEAVAERLAGRHGREITRLRTTEKLCRDGLTLAGRGSTETVMLVALLRLMLQRKEEAEQDNQELYRDVIPRTLEPTPGHRVANPTFQEELFSPSSLSRPIFTNLKVL